MRLRLDPWEAEYNTAYHAASIDDNNNPPIDNPDIEHSEWIRVKPEKTEKQLDSLSHIHKEIIFIDGSRRIEARGRLEDESGQSPFVALGTYAIGAVKCCAFHSKAAEFIDIEKEVNIRSINRLLTVSSDGVYNDFKIEGIPNKNIGELNYEVSIAETNDSDSVVVELQNRMLAREADLAQELQKKYPDALIVRDGLRRGKSQSKDVVGYVKTIHKLRPNLEQLNIIRQLEQGERSPIYGITDGAKSSNLEWFLRLRDPAPYLYSLAGIVRVQATPDMDIEEAAELADWLCYKLPRFSTRQHQDPRAPQQLLPIRALEAEMRRQMGHPQIVRRRIMQHVAPNEILNPL